MSDDAMYLKNWENNVLVILVVWLFSFKAHGALVGYGSSDAVYPAKNQEFFYMGFNLGLKKAEILK